MKVITAGNPQADVEEWWIGRRATCRQCRVVVELESTDRDRVDEHQEATFGGRRFVVTECPTDFCTGQVELLDTSDSPLAPGEFNPPPAKP